MYELLLSFLENCVPMIDENDLWSCLIVSLPPLTVLFSRVRSPL